MVSHIREGQVRGLLPAPFDMVNPLRGMGGCLSVCSNAAKTLAAATNKPLVGVHHMVRPTIYKLRSSQRFEFQVLASPRSDTIPNDTRYLISFSYSVNLWRTHPPLARTIADVVPNFSNHT